MLDVHPPHHAASTWRDFFIHIGTICVGLLIAVGIEQTIEAVHYHRQVAEAHDALHRELLDNVHRFRLATANLESAAPALRGDLATFVYLRAHPGAPAGQWPYPIRGEVMPVLYAQGAWRSIQQSGVVEHLSQAEIAHFDRLYTRLTIMNDVEVRKRRALNESHMEFAVQPDAASMTPAEIDAEIHALEELLSVCAESANLQRLLSLYVPAFDHPPAEQFRQGGLLQWPGAQAPDPGFAATVAEYAAIEQRQENEFAKTGGER